MTFVPIDVERKIKAAVALLQNVAVVTAMPLVRAEVNKVIGQLVRVEPDALKNTLVAVALNLADTQGLARVAGDDGSADSLDGIGLLLRSALARIIEIDG